MHSKRFTREVVQNSGLAVMIVTMEVQHLTPLNSSECCSHQHYDDSQRED
jgi:hypothetical protein